MIYHGGGGECLSFHFVLADFAWEGIHLLSLCYEFDAGVIAGAVLVMNVTIVVFW